jgi:hypothetical protein
VWDESVNALGVLCAGAPSFEVHGEDSVQTIEPFQLHVPALEKVDVRTSYELAHYVGYEDLATERLAGNARRIVNGRPEELVGLVEGVAAVDSYSDAYRRRAVGD